MKMINELILVKVTQFHGTDTPDKNGEKTLMLQLQAGRMPNRQTLAGTVAKRAGFEEGKTYLANVGTAGEDALFGEDFTWLAIQEITSPLDIVKLKKELGEPILVTIERPEGYGEDSYERKSVAIESQRTVREREGKYRRINQARSTHETAKRIIPGSSVGSGGNILNDAVFKESSGSKEVEEDENKLKK